MKLSFAILASFIFSTIQLDGCQPCCVINDEVFYTTEENLLEIQNSGACREFWGGWECCHCKYLNGDTMRVCQRRQKPKCGIR